MARIMIVLDLDADKTSVAIDDMPGHGGRYDADAYRVRKYNDPVKVIRRWADINDGYEDGQRDHQAFMDRLAKTYGSRVATVVSQLMVADMAWTEEQDREWGKTPDQSF